MTWVVPQARMNVPVSAKMDRDAISPCQFRNYGCGNRVWLIGLSHFTNGGDVVNIDPEFRHGSKNQ